MNFKFFNLCVILSLWNIQFSSAVPNDVLQLDHKYPKMEMKNISDSFDLLSENQDLMASDTEKHEDEKIIVASKQGYSEIVKSLVEEGVNINIHGDKGITPLMEAAFFGRFSIVKYLVDKGADVDARADDGSTAPQLAALGQHWEIVDFLKKQISYKQETISPFGISLPVSD